MRVLLIEPDQVLGRVYTAALEQAGHEVALARSAQGAVHAADSSCPDIVVLELQLPRHNGIEFLYEFRSYSEWLHLPVVIHSQVAPHEYEKSTILQRELGVVRCLHKPATSLEQLVAAVAAYVPAITK
jgi:DNA-binding response OmpR family regulator